VRAFVAGGSGFTGSRVIPLLVAAGHEVVALARSEVAAASVERLGATASRGDFDRPDELRLALEQAAPDVFVNVASLGFGHGPDVVAGAEKAGVARAVFVSTTAIFTALDAPTKPVRVAAERAIEESSLDATIVRPTMIYGHRGDRNMERLLASLRRWPAWPLPGGGHHLMQPVHVEDLAAAIAAAAVTPEAAGRAYDIAGPQPIPFRQIVRTAAAAVGRRPLLVPIPLAPAIAVLRVYERRTAHPRLKAEQLERLEEDKAFDITDARRDLHHDPRSFAEGIGAEAAELGIGPEEGAHRGSR
jgi:nucleoside-diphosphate-sugar epimerase